MSLVFESFGALPNNGEAMRMISNQPDAAVFGMFRNRLVYGKAIYLQPKHMQVYREILEYGFDGINESLTNALLQPHKSGLGFSAIAGCNVYMEIWPEQDFLRTPRLFLDQEDLELAQALLDLPNAPDRTFNKMFTFNRGE